MSGKLHAISAAVLLAVIAFAGALAASPQLHTWLHHASDWTHHECAATLLSSGSVEEPGCEPVLRAPQSVPPAAILLPPTFRVARPALEFTRLEHAPPSLS